MKLEKNKFQGFTLIEILVSITILWIMMISVFGIFIASSDVNFKTDITRLMQQNIKSSVERITEDVRKNWYWLWVTSNAEDLEACSGITSQITETKSWNKLCISENISYYLIEKNWDRIFDWKCEEIDKSCTVVVDYGDGPKPIMNSWVDVKSLEFLISGKEVQKVTIIMTLQPAIWKWIKPKLIENNRFHFQTTISERNTLN